MKESRQRISNGREGVSLRNTGQVKKLPLLGEVHFSPESRRNFYVSIVCLFFSTILSVVALPIFFDEFKFVSLFDDLSLNGLKATKWIYILTTVLVPIVFVSVNLRTGRRRWNSHFCSFVSIFTSVVFLILWLSSKAGANTHVWPNLNSVIVTCLFLIVLICAHRLKKLISIVGRKHLFYLVPLFCVLGLIYFPMDIDTMTPRLQGNLQYYMGDFEGAIAQKIPLVNFIPLYTNILPILFKPYFEFVGFDILTFTSLLALLTLLIFFIVRHILLRSFETFGFRTEILFWMVLSCPFILSQQSRLYDSHRYSNYVPANYFAIFPLRLIGPFLVILFFSRLVNKSSENRIVLLYVLASLVMINNLDFGLISLISCVYGTMFINPKKLNLEKLILKRIAISIGVVLTTLALYVLTVFLLFGKVPQLDLAIEFHTNFLPSAFDSPNPPVFGFAYIMFSTYLIGTMASIDYLFKKSSQGVDESSTRHYVGSLLAFFSFFGVGTMSYYYFEPFQNNMSRLLMIWAVHLLLLIRYYMVSNEFELDIRSISGRKVVHLVWNYSPLAICFLILSFQSSNLVRHIFSDSPRFYSSLKNSKRKESAYWEKNITGYNSKVKQLQQNNEVVIFGRHSQLIAKMNGLVNVSPFPNGLALGSTKMVRKAFDLSPIKDHQFLSVIRHELSEQKFSEIIRLLAELNFSLIRTEAHLSVFEQKKSSALSEQEVTTK